jgi:hypothetical protein
MSEPWIERGGRLEAAKLQDPSFLANVQAAMNNPLCLYRFVAFPNSFDPVLRKLDHPQAELKQHVQRLLAAGLRIELHSDHLPDAFVLMLKRFPDDQADDEVVRPLRLSLLGVLVRTALDGQFPPISGRVLLASLARLPAIDHESFEFGEYEAMLRKRGLELKQVEDLQRDLCAGKFSALTDCKASSVTNEDLMGDQTLTKDLQAIGMPVNIRALRWVEALSSVDPAGFDRWALLSWSEITSSGPATDSIIERMSEKLRFTADHDHVVPTELKSKSAWTRQLHFDLWCSVGQSRVEVVHLVRQDRQEALGSTPTDLGRVLAACVELTLMGANPEAKAILRAFRIPEDELPLSKLRAAWRNANWKPFRIEISDINPRVCAAIADGTPPREPPELSSSGYSLIENCQRQRLDNFVAALPDHLTWLAHMAAATPPSVDPHDSDGSAVDLLARVRIKLIQVNGPMDIDELSEDQKLSLALLARRRGIDADAAIDQIASSLVKRTEAKLTCDDLARPQAVALIKEARRALVASDNTPAVSSLAQALRATNAESFQSGVGQQPPTRPHVLGSPRLRERIVSAVLSPAMLLCLLIVAILGWTASTYIPGDIRLIGGVLAAQEQQVHPSELGFRKNGAGWIFEQPVSRECFISIAETTAPLPSALNQAVSVSRAEASEWCIRQTDYLKARYPYLFEQNGPFAGCVGRLPRRSEMGPEHVDDEWTSDEDPSLTASRGESLGDRGTLGVRKIFRLILSPALAGGAQ